MDGVQKTSGVIWISGYSAAGKTTVGRLVVQALRDRGANCVFLDGDDLRSIFGDRWGYERSDRVDLARVYFRLCSHLASQGTIVVIAAVALYEEVRRWFHENVSNAFQVYLDVSLEERLERDRGTKNVYQRIGNLDNMYDFPEQLDLIVANGKSSDLRTNVDQIISCFLEWSERADFGRSRHWGKFYARGSAPGEPSSFARHVAALIGRNLELVDIGCGNGRDSRYFASLGHRVLGLDPSEAAIAASRNNRTSCNRTAEFWCGDLPKLAREVDGRFDVAYCRFVLHAMPLAEEVETLAAACTVLRPGGDMFIECRSINDPMARQGEVISPTERIHGHYRRFIVPDELRMRLQEAGFIVNSLIEERGLSPVANDDPVLIRAHGSKANL